MQFANKKVLVLGCFGLSGKSAIKMLKTLGADVYFFDDKYVEDCAQSFINLNAKSCFKFDINEEFVNKLMCVVVAPSIPMDNTILVMARKLNKPIISELELGFELCRGKVLAITGTNGKSTSTTLLHEVLRADNKNSYLLGNIGTPICHYALQLQQDDYACVEVSSYMLENIHNFKPSISCMLNIQEDHLKRHLTMQNYINAKMRIFENQAPDDSLVLNYDDEVVRGFDKLANCNVEYFSLNKKVNGTYIKDDFFYYKTQKLFSIDYLKISGRHNLANALSVINMSMLLGVQAQSIQNAFSNFKGLAHRMQFVRNIGGVDIINDSKATNVASTLTALACVNKPTALLLGGFDKGESFEPLAENLPLLVKHIYVYGANANIIIDAFEKYNIKHWTRVMDLKQALYSALEMKMLFSNILLSPASASFDSFNNFEHRGDYFVSLVNDYGEI